MKREIKFRAWILHPLNNQDPYMYQWCDNFFSDMTEVTKWGDEFPKDENEVILMQYTGLKDKNGKEIYEDDLVNVRPYNKPKWEIGKIHWLDAYYQWCIECYYNGDPKCGKFGFRLHEPLEIEVIGNIYENPELL